MAKLKVKDLKGLFTNYDENDLNLEYIRDTANFRFGKGKGSYEKRNLSEYTLPDLAADFPSHSFKWETGIYCTLTGDTLSKDLVGEKYNILVLVAKVLDNGTYHRVVYMKDIGSGSIWYELSKNGNLANIDILNHIGASDFSQSYLSTEIDGKVFFRVEGGRLKIHFPHDSFWLGKLDRNLQFTGISVPEVELDNQWYFDRLIEPYDETNQSLIPGPPNILGGLIGHGTASPGRRLGWRGKVEITEDPDLIVDDRPISLSPTTDYWDTIVRYDDTGSGHRCHVYAFDAVFDDNGTRIPTVVPFKANIPDLENKVWLYLWYNGYISPTDAWVVYLAKMYESLEPYDEVTGVARDLVLEGLAVYNAPNDGYIQRRNPDGSIQLNEGSYRIKISDFLNIKWRYIGGAKVSKVGYPAVTPEFSIAVTQILDEREEILVYCNTFNLGPTLTWVPYISNSEIPFDINKRITRQRFYFKLKDEPDFRMMHEQEFLNIDLEESKNEKIYLTELQDTGILLSQNIGTLIDPEELYRYRIVTGYKSYTVDAGVGIGVASLEDASVNYSTVAGGHLMSDLCYLDSRLPLSNVSSINAVAAINGKFGVFTNDRLFIITPAPQDTYILFSVIDTLEYGVKNIYDIAEVQGGIVIHTNLGIFFTNGYDKTIISEQINNIVKANYATGSIKYNPIKQELYYKPTTSEDLYIYRFEDKLWERLNATITTTQIEEETELELD